MKKLIYLLCIPLILWGCSDKYDDERSIVSSTTFTLPSEYEWKESLQLDSLYRIDSAKELKAIVKGAKSKTEWDIDFDKESLLLVHMITGNMKQVQKNLIADSPQLYIYDITLNHYTEGVENKDIIVSRYLAIKTPKISNNTSIKLSVKENQ